MSYFEICEECFGEGEIWETCPYCGGAGCDDCDDTGEQIRYCWECDGTGVVLVDEGD